MKPVLYSAKVRFEDKNVFKKRPVLVIAIKGNIAICRKVTSKDKRSNYSGEYVLKDWKEEGAS